jgi:hypothetical protein
VSQAMCEGSAQRVTRILHTKSDEGVVGLLTAIGGLIVATVSMAVIAAVAGVGVAAARARTAADAAALAAMTASPVVSGVSAPGTSEITVRRFDIQDGALVTRSINVHTSSIQGSPEREAARLAFANGARLVEVNTAGWPFHVRVTVEVQPRRQLPPLRAHATASARPATRRSAVTHDSPVR